MPRRRHFAAMGKLGPSDVAPHIVLTHCRAKRYRSAMILPSERLRQEQDRDLEQEVRDIVEKDKRLRFRDQVKVVDSVMRRKDEMLPGKENLRDLISEEAERALKAE